MAVKRSSSVTPPPASHPVYDENASRITGIFEASPWGGLRPALLGTFDRRPGEGVPGDNRLRLQSAPTVNHLNSTTQKHGARVEAQAPALISDCLVRGVGNLDQ